MMMDRGTVKFCEKWLCFWTTLAEKLASTQFTERDVFNFIKYEMHTRRRKHVLKRLTGRYYKMMRARRWIAMKKDLENASFGKGDRRSLEERS